MLKINDNFFHVFSQPHFFLQVFFCSFMETRCGLFNDEIGYKRVGKQNKIKCKVTLILPM